MTLAYPVALHQFGNALRVVASEDHATLAATTAIVTIRPALPGSGPSPEE